MEKYLSMTIAQLKEEAKTRGLKGVSTMKKQELAELLSAADRMQTQKQQTKPEEGTVKKAAEEKKVAADKSGRAVSERGRQQGRRTIPQNAGAQERPTAGRPAQPQNTGAQERPVGRPTQPQNAGAQERPVGRTAQPQNAGAQERPTASRPAQPQNTGAYERPAGRPAQPQNTGTYERPAGRPAQPQNTGAQERPTVSRPAQSQNVGAYERPMAGRPAQPQNAGAGAPETAYTVTQQRFDPDKATPADLQSLDSGETRVGILEVMSENFGFIRCDNYLPGENDVYVSPAQIRRFGLKTGDIICGNTKIRAQNEKFSALLYIKNVNGISLEEIAKRKRFEDLTPIFPNERIHLETPGCSLSMRMVDLISPIGKGQRGMIVSQPKAGKTTLLKQIAKAITTNHPDMNMIILLIDERPEEVTDIKESIEGQKVEVIYSTFDELPENHKRVSEMVIERAKRLVEQKQDVVILLDSITRLARAYNLTIPASGRTLSGGLDPAALHMPKKFFGAARNMREGGSLTILATALVETGSRMDDVVFEEFKGTGNMELQLDRNLSERRVFPAIDLLRSSTRRDDLLLTKEEQEATALMRRMFNSSKAEESLENIIRTFQTTKNNKEFVEMIKKYR